MEKATDACLPLAQAGRTDTPDLSRLAGCFQQKKRLTVRFFSFLIKTLKNS